MHCLVLLLPLLAGVVQADQCGDVKKEFNECTKTAHQTYLAAMTAKEEDGRPDYKARKTCNYLVDAIETCGNKLMQHKCNTEEAVTTMKDAQISKVLTSIGQSVEGFDSCKCPAVKAHMNRVKAASGAEVVKECPPEEPATDGASSVLAGLLLLPLLVVHHL